MIKLFERIRIDSTVQGAKEPDENHIWRARGMDRDFKRKSEHTGIRMKLVLVTQESSGPLDTLLMGVGLAR